MESLERYLKYVPLAYAWVSGSWATGFIYAVVRDWGAGWITLDLSLMIVFAIFAVLSARSR